MLAQDARDLLSHMDISLRRFLETGMLGDLQVGMNVEQVRTQLGTPHDTGGTSRKYPRPSVYVYGSVELFFSQKKPILCTAIYWYAHRGEFRLTPGDHIEDWGLLPGMDRAEVESYLRQAQLEFDDPRRSSTALAETLVVPSGITISFDDNKSLYAVAMWLR